MKCRFTYAGAAGLLLTLACGSKVEIGHGEPGGAGGAGGSMTAETGGKLPEAGQASSEGGEPAEVPTAGSSGGGRVTGGLPPADNGPQRETGRVDLLLAID